MLCSAKLWCGGKTNTWLHRQLAERPMHTIHLSGNTSGVSKSSSDWLNYTGFPGDVSVAFFNVLPGNKDAMALNSPPHALVFTTIDGHLSGSTKRCIFYVKNVKFKSYNLSNMSESFTHRSVIVVTFPRPKT